MNLFMVGMVIRTGVKQIRIMSRATQGVRIVNIKPGDKVTDLIKIMSEAEVVVGEEK